MSTLGACVPAAVGFALFAFGCVVPGDTPFGPLDDIPPEVVHTLPVDGVDGVPVDVRPEIRFSEAMDWDRITDDHIRLESGAVTADVTLDFGRTGQRVLVVVPAEPLVPDVQWTLTLSGEVTDAFFNPLGEDFEIGFRTDAAPEPFVVTDSEPEEGAEAVPVNTSVRIEFSVPVAEPSVISANFRLRTDEDGAVSSTLEREEDGFAVRLTPRSDLDPDAGYVAIVSADVVAITGQRLDEDVVVGFTTAAP